MLDAQQTPNTDPASSGGDSGDAIGAANAVSAAAADPTQEAMRLVAEATGRKFTSVEEAKKFLTNLNKMVGNPRLREDAELMDTIAAKYAEENKLTRREAREKLAELAGSAPVRQWTDDDVSPVLQAKVERLETEAFLARNPEAEGHLEKVRSYARATGKELADAYTELYGDVLKKSSANASDKRGEKLSASVTASSTAMPAVSINKVDKLKEEYKKTGNPKLFREIVKAKADRDS
jgi:hypothetical protein